MNFCVYFWKPSNETTTQVTLSTVLLKAEVLKMPSTQWPQLLCTSSSVIFLTPDLLASIRTFCHPMWMASLLESLSNTPSHPITIKSWFSFISKAVTSGSAMTTLGFPSYFSSFASMSPTVLETDKRPGNTLCGP